MPRPLLNQPNRPSAERLQDTKPKTPAPKAALAKPKRTRTGVSSQEDEEEFEEAFRVFAWSQYATKWEDIPWGGKQAVLGMLGWGLSFVAVGLALIPVARQVAGPAGFASLSQQDKALFALVNQVAATAAGVGVINLAVRKFRPLPPDLLRVDLRGAFRKPDGWAAWGLLGVLLSPAVVYLASVASEALGTENPAARGTADAVSQILSLDGLTFGSLFITTAVLAPVLEETVFRGFLLPSLAKYMPTPAAVLLSSLAFGLVHLSPRDTPQLTALGILLGFSYVRSRNLLTPMIIHGTWNGTVLCVLYALQASGVDLQEVLHGGL